MKLETLQSFSIPKTANA